ncbi:hypothetical protein HPP92_008475 [Vanilla planifolia]|uniref:Uncharacterized protein n=1 Tax=Vanilla planifolia TaxID=51239 RepID=A0A835R6E2_VANPL|nr:hypothetical protein HPP92_008475 [Vanilla planifolia]
MASQHESHETDSSKDDRQQQKGKGTRRHISRGDRTVQSNSSTESIDAIKAAEQRYVNAKAIRLRGPPDTKEAVARPRSNHNLPFCKKAPKQRTPPLTGLALPIKHVGERESRAINTEDTSLTAAQRTEN